MSDDIRKRVMSVDTPKADDSQQDQRQPIDLADALMAIARTLDRLNTLLDRQESPLTGATRPQPKPSEEVLPLTIEPRDVAPVDGNARGDVAKTTLDMPDAMAARLNDWLASPAVPPAIKQEAVLPLANAPLRDVRQWLQPANGEAPPRFVAVAGGAWPQPQVLEARPAGGAIDIGNGVPVKEQANQQPLPELPAVESFMAAMMPLAFNAKSSDRSANNSQPLPVSPSSEPRLPDMPTIEQAVKEPLPFADILSPPGSNASPPPSSDPSPLSRWFNNAIAASPPTFNLWPSISQSTFANRETQSTLPAAGRVEPANDKQGDVLPSLETPSANPQPFTPLGNVTTQPPKQAADAMPFPPLPAVEQAIGNMLPNIQPAALPTTQTPSDSLEPSSRPISPTDAWMKQFLAQPASPSLPPLPAISTAAAMPSAQAGQTVTPNATPVTPVPAYAQPFPAWLPSPKIPLDGEVVNTQPPSPSSWPTFPLTLPAMDGEQMANVRDMPPWMQHNMGTTDSNRDILSAMQGFSDAQRGFAETVLKSITHTTNELRVIQLRLENINRYFHSDL